MKTERPYPKAYISRRRANTPPPRDIRGSTARRRCASRARASTAELIGRVREKGKLARDGLLQRQFQNTRPHYLAQRQRPLRRRVLGAQRCATPGTTAKASWRPGDLGCCRLIFGEADGFPGLTVDRFGNRARRAGHVARHGKDQKHAAAGARSHTARGRAGRYAACTSATTSCAARKGGHDAEQGLVSRSPARNDAGEHRHRHNENGDNLPCGFRERAEDRLLPRPEVQPPRRRGASRAAEPCSTASRTPARSRSTPPEAAQST
jgi:hypothetical protein